MCLLKAAKQPGKMKIHYFATSSQNGGIGPMTFQSDAADPAMQLKECRQCEINAYIRKGMKLLMGRFFERIKGIWKPKF